MTASSTTKKMFLTLGWLTVCLCISIIWLAVKENFYTEVASIPTSNPKTVALFFSAIVAFCKVGLLLPFLFIWRKPKADVIWAGCKSPSQQCHPDKHPRDTDKVKQIRKIISDGCRVLSDPQLLREHDEYMGRAEHGQAPSNNEEKSGDTCNKPQKAHPRPNSAKPFPHYQKGFVLSKDIFNGRHQKKPQNQSALPPDNIRNREEKIRCTLREQLGRAPNDEEIERAKWDGMCLEE